MFPGDKCMTIGGMPPPLPLAAPLNTHLHVTVDEEAGILDTRHAWTVLFETISLAYDWLVSVLPREQLKEADLQAYEGTYRGQAPGKGAHAHIQSQG